MTKKRWILAVVVVALVVGVFSMVSYAGRIFPGGMAMGYIWKGFASYRQEGYLGWGYLSEVCCDGRRLLGL